MKKKSAIVVALMLAGLTACNDDNSNSSTDNGGGNTEASSYSVTAIDGYLRGAEVWLDINEDFQWDSSEPHAVTGDGGKAELDITGVDNPERYPLMVQVLKGKTIDEDTITEENPHGTEVETAYVMSAPAGETAVTPISTLVHVKTKQLEAQGVSKADAQAQAKKETAEQLGVSEEKLLGDFKQNGHHDVAFAARNVVEAQVLPDEPAKMQTAVDDAESFNQNTEAVNSLIKEAIEEAGDDLASLENKAPVVSVPEDVKDTDGDGVPDHLDAFPYDATKTKLSQKLAYDTFYGGNQIKASDDNNGGLDDSSGYFTGTTHGHSMWFYTPYPEELVDAGYLLSSVADFSFEVNKDVSAFNGGKNVFANIYVTPKDDKAYERIQTAAVSTKNGAPLRDTNWNTDVEAEDTYVITVKTGETLNEVMEAVGASKADFKLLSFVDLTWAEDGKDPEVTNGNFVLKLGGSNYQGSEAFKVDSYSFNPTFKIGDGPEFVVANAVSLKQDTDGTVTGESYGQRIWAYVPMKGDAYAAIAPLSDYKDFVFESTAEDSFVSIYVVIKDGVDDGAISARAKSGTPFETVDWIKNNNLQPQNKMVYAINVLQKDRALQKRIDELGLNFDDFEIISYVDGGQDGDPAGQGNFFFKNAGSSSKTNPFELSKFEY